MKKGEDVLVKVEYDLFGLCLKGLKGIYISTNEDTKKVLLHFFQNQEWAELEKNQIKRIKPDFVSEKNKEFISRITKL